MGLRCGRVDVEIIQAECSELSSCGVSFFAIPHVAFRVPVAPSKDGGGAAEEGGEKGVVDWLVGWLRVMGNLFVDMGRDSRDFDMGECGGWESSCVGVWLFFRHDYEGGHCGRWCSLET